MKQLTLSTGDPLDADPPQDEHCTVVVDVEEADLVELFPQNEKDCIQEFHSFGDIVPPKSRRYLKMQKRHKGRYVKHTHHCVKLHL